MLEKEEAYMALDLVTPFTKVQLEEEIKDTGRKQVGILGGNFNLFIMPTWLLLISTCSS